MMRLVSEQDVSRAWVRAVVLLLESPGRELSNLCVSIQDPVKESKAVRARLDEFRKAALAHSGNLQSVDTVANTIFPRAFYRPDTKDPVKHLLDLERRTRGAVHRHRQNRRGTYFERMVAYPGSSGECDQLTTLLKHLSSAHHRGVRNGNQYELTFYSPEKDSYPVNFPCLSHVSLNLVDGHLGATAIYRNHFFISRAYGNYLGLGRLLNFLATETSYDIGELVCISSHAFLDVDSSRGYGIDEVRRTIADCSALVEEAGDGG